MLTKILVTALVIIAVITFYRFKNAGRSGIAAKRAQAALPANNRFGRMVAYGFVGFLLAVSAVWYGLYWMEQHRIITIRVIGESGTTIYKAYNKDLEGNRFRTVDGRTVILGQSERVEIIDTE